jgi:hypothetical protein
MVGKDALVVTLTNASRKHPAGTVELQATTVLLHVQELADGDVMHLQKLLALADNPDPLGAPASIGLANEVIFRPSLSAACCMPVKSTALM